MILMVAMISPWAVDIQATRPYGVSSNYPVIPVKVRIQAGRHPDGRIPFTPLEARFP